jgi:PIN domain nuclease of toxin-antitoxin system
LKGYLLDTSIALIGVNAPERLSRTIRKAVDRGPAFVSTISYWEVMIKSMKGTLGEIGDPRQWWATALKDLALRPLAQSAEHIAAIYGLPPIHHDPFDRALIAQAIAEDLTLVTTDSYIPKYTSGRLKVLA